MTNRASKTWSSRRIWLKRNKHRDLLSLEMEAKECKQKPYTWWKNWTVRYEHLTGRICKLVHQALHVIRKTEEETQRRSKKTWSHKREQWPGYQWTRRMLFRTWPHSTVNKCVSLETGGGRGSGRGSKNGGGGGYTLQPPYKRQQEHSFFHIPKKGEDKECVCRANPWSESSFQQEIHFVEIWCCILRIECQEKVEHIGAKGGRRMRRPFEHHEGNQFSPGKECKEKL
jgi:hypothetical protein